MRLLIVGAGGFATEVEELARLVGYDIVEFIDDNPVGARCLPVVGETRDLCQFVGKYDAAIVALGNNDKRLELHEKLLSLGYHVPTLIHPTAYVSRDAQIEPGCIIRTYATVGRYARLGSATILNVGVNVDHDCIIGEGSHLLIGSVVRNSRNIAAKTWLNANEVVE